MAKFVTLLAFQQDSSAQLGDWKFVSNSDLFWNFFDFKNYLIYMTHLVLYLFKSRIASMYVYV